MATAQVIRMTSGNNEACKQGTEDLTWETNYNLAWCNHTRETEFLDVIKFQFQRLTWEKR